jgi:hypothetical protein
MIGPGCHLAPLYDVLALVYFYFVFNSARSTTVTSVPQLGQISRAGSGVYRFMDIGSEQRSH